MQARTIHGCDTQLLYGASGPSVSEGGSCRASDTCALQGYVQMCMRSTLCSGDRHATGITDKELITNKQTWDATLFQQSSCHCRMTGSHAITPDSRQQGNLQLTHFQCSPYVWSRNHGRVTSIHAADSVTFAERVRISKSRSPYEVHSSCEHCSQIQQTCCTFTNVFVKKSVIPWYAHPDSQMPYHFVTASSGSICATAHPQQPHRLSISRIHRQQVCLCSFHGFYQKLFESFKRQHNWL